MEILSSVKNRLKFLIEHVWISLILVGITGFFLRILYFPYEIPIILDGLFYFWFAYDTSTLGQLPTSYYIENDGWPIFLSFIFRIFHFDSFFDYITLQRSVTILLSLVTSVFVYLLCRKFFDVKYALIGAIIFVLEPRIIQNSILGITEPLYLLLVTCSLVLFFSSNKKLIFISFGFVSLATVVRAEALFLFIAFTILYFVRFRTDQKMILKYTIAFSIFVLLLIPIVTYRIDNYGGDGILSKVIRSQSEIGISTGNDNSNWILFGINGGINTIKFLGWDLIPIFIFFVPIGFVLCIIKRNFQNMSIILILIIMLGPAWFSYLNNSDTRFLFVLYPLFCVLSLFGIEKISNKFDRKNVILALIVAVIFFASISFLEYKKTDYESERDAFIIAEFVSQNTGGINSSTMVSKYIQSAEINLKWPNLPTLNSDNSIPTNTKIISDMSFTTLEDFITNSRDIGLTHLVIDDKTKIDYLLDVFNHPEKYSFLNKEYDSKDQNHKLWVKIFKINYDEYDLIKNNLI